MLSTQAAGVPKLIIWDIAANCAVQEFVFPDDVMPYDASWANDIVVDETNGFACVLQHFFFDFFPLPLTLFIMKMSSKI
jgi:hypothetical protein